MKRLAVHNIKGGVGKTTTAVNLGWEISHAGWRVLLWDLDPQGAASYYLRIRDEIDGGGRRLLRGKSPVQRHLRATDYEGLDLLPADFSYRHLDLYLDAERAGSGALRRLLAPLGDDYDCLLLDCPPSFSRLSEAVYDIADFVLVPVLPSPLSLRTLHQLWDYCERAGYPLARLLPFFSMVDPDNLQHDLIANKLPPRRYRLLRSHIPLSATLEAMALQRRPVGDYAPQGAEAAAYRRLWREIEGRMAEAPPRR